MMIQYQLTEDDYVNAQRAYQKNASPAMKLVQILLIAVGACLGVAISVGGKLDAKDVAIVAILVFVLVVGVTFSNGIYARIRFRKIKNFHSPMELKVDDTEFFLKSAYSESKISWSAFERWVEGKDIFLLYPQPRIFFMVPKRVLSEEQISSFRDLLNSHIVKRK